MPPGLNLPTRRAYRIGFLLPGDNTQVASRVEIVGALTTMGWRENTDFVVREQYAGLSHSDAVLNALVDLLIADRVRVIVAGSTTTAIAAKKRTMSAAGGRARRAIPVVMALAGDPEAALVDAVEQPGGNVTGMTDHDEDLPATQLRLLEQFFPGGLNRVAVLANPLNPGKAQEKIDLDAAKGPIITTYYTVSDAASVVTAFNNLAGAGDQAVIVMGDPVTVARQPTIMAQAIARGLPIVHGSVDSVERPDAAAALLCYGPSHRGVFRRAAVHIVRILKGEAPARIPVEGPPPSQCVYNTETEGRFQAVHAAFAIPASIKTNPLARAFP
jgi:putative ABC transport system substrate-binding protein